MKVPALRHDIAGQINRLPCVDILAILIGQTKDDRCERRWKRSFSMFLKSEESPQSQSLIHLGAQASSLSFCLQKFFCFIGLRSLAGSIKFEVNYLLWDIQRCVMLYTPAVPPLRMMAGFVLGIGCIDTVLNFRINLGRDRFWVLRYLPTSEKACCWSEKRWRWLRNHRSMTSFKSRSGFLP